MTVRPLVSSDTLTGSPLTLSTFTSGFLHRHEVSSAPTDNVSQAYRTEVFAMRPTLLKTRNRCGTLLDEGVLSL